MRRAKKGAFHALPPHHTERVFDTRQETSLAACRPAEPASELTRIRTNAGAVYAKRRESFSAKRLNRSVHIRAFSSE